MGVGAQFNMWENNRNNRSVPHAQRQGVKSHAVCLEGSRTISSLCHDLESCKTKLHEPQCVILIFNRRQTNAGTYYYFNTVLALIRLNYPPFIQVTSVINGAPS